MAPSSWEGTQGGLEGFRPAGDRYIPAAAVGWPLNCETELFVDVCGLVGKQAPVSRKIRSLGLRCHQLAGWFYAAAGFLWASTSSSVKWGH